MWKAVVAAVGLRIVAAASFTVAGVPAMAHAAPLASSAVEKAKASIVRDADTIFTDTWRNHEAQVASSLTARQAQSVALWVTIGASLGQCSEYLGQNDYPDWVMAFEVLGFHDRYAEASARVRGLEAFSGASEQRLASTPRKRQFCMADIAAARALLTGPEFAPVDPRDCVEPPRAPAALEASAPAMTTGPSDAAAAITAPLRAVQAARPAATGSEAQLRSLFENWRAGEGGAKKPDCIAPEADVTSPGVAR